MPPFLTIHIALYSMLSPRFFPLLAGISKERREDQTIKRAPP
jgi:hypothetical protein